MTKSLKGRYLRVSFSLIEILIALAIFTIGISSVVFFAIDSYKFSKNSNNRTKADQLLDETVNAIVMVKNTSWKDIMLNSDGSAKHITLENGKYVIQNGSSVVNGISIEFTITNAYRDSSGNILDTGGNEDVHSKTVNVTVSWKNITGATTSHNYKFYISDWNTKTLKDDLFSQFSLGSNYLTRVLNASGGEVGLDTVVYADWCKPSLTMTTYDLVRQGIPYGIAANSEEIVIGTGQNSSGVSFTKLLTDGNDPPGITTEGNWDGVKTNDIFIDGKYAYLATDANDKEVLIMDISVYPYTQVGYFNTPSSSRDATSIFVSGNYGYVTAGYYLYIFNLSSKIGSRPQVATYLLHGDGTSVVVFGNYAYVTVDSDWYQLKVLNISDPYHPNWVGYVDIVAYGGVDVAINETGTRAVLATRLCTCQGTKEIYLVDITNKNGAMRIIGSYDTGSMTPTAVAFASSNRVIVTGLSGTEYQVLDISNESLPFYCGGMNVDTGIYGLTTIKNMRNTVYSYIVTGDTTSELKIIRGGPGGGNGSGYGYPASGYFTSKVFDSGSSESTYYTIGWEGTVPNGGSVKFQVRSGNTSDLSSYPWVGPDGTSSTYFTDSSGDYLPVALSGKRYIQYRIYFTSDMNSTPIVNYVYITYQ